MATSRIPALIDALVAQLPALLGANNVTVFDGYGVSNTRRDTVMVGVDNRTAANPAFSAQSTQDPATANSQRNRDQNGAVTCAFYARRGAGANQQKAARDAVYGYLALLEGALRADPTLGIAAGGNFQAQIGDERLSQNQNNKGADALLVFNVRFFARL